MPTIRLKKSNLKYLFLICVSLSFFLASVLILIYGKYDDLWIGWMNLFFFGACIAVFVSQIMNSGVQIVISEAGIEDTTLGVGIIPWKDICGAHVKTFHGYNFICLELRDQDKWTGKLSTLNRAAIPANIALGFTPININLAGLTVDPYQLLELILKNSSI